MWDRKALNEFARDARIGIETKDGKIKWNNESLVSIRSVSELNLLMNEYRSLAMVAKTISSLHFRSRTASATRRIKSSL